MGPGHPPATRNNVSSRPPISQLVREIRVEITCEFSADIVGSINCLTEIEKSSSMLRHQRSVQGLFSPSAVNHLQSSWQGVFRHVLLETMPVGTLSKQFHPSMGAPTKELYSMAGLVFLTDFFDWSGGQAIEAYMLHYDVQYALNIDRESRFARGRSSGIRLCSKKTTCQRR
jgi:hypothetical protein